MCEQIPVLRDPLHVHTSIMGLQRHGRHDFSGSSGRVTLCIICQVRDPKKARKVTAKELRDVVSKSLSTNREIVDADDTGDDGTVEEVASTVADEAPEVCNRAEKICIAQT